MFPRQRLAALGGYASRAEMLNWGCTVDEIDLAVRYGWILSVRKGFYVSTTVHPILLPALRIGGRLACVSALAWHARGDLDLTEPVHVVIPANGSRLRAGDAIVHWSRRHLAGSRLVVFEEEARLQAANCRWLKGRRGPDKT